MLNQIGNAVYILHIPIHFAILHFTIYLYILLLEQIHIYVTSNTYENTEQSSVVVSGINTAKDKL